VASDGYPLHYRHWRPQSKPRAYVVALHGVQSHSGWFTYSSGRLCADGFDVRFLDRRGSGLNSTDRGHVVHADRLVNDVAQFLTGLQWERDREAPGCPIILLAVSWGGRLAAALCGRRSTLIDGLALLYPGICTRFRPRIHHKCLLRLAHGCGRERLLVQIPLDDPQLFTAEPDWQEFIRHDPLALHQASVGFLLASDQLQREALAAAHTLGGPALLMLAGRDQIIDNRATLDFVARCRSADFTVVQYPDASHTLEFERDREPFVADLIGWLEGVADGRPPSPN
jgi:alpha-beta hydrolase superfamily lysophospholipase